MKLFVWKTGILIQASFDMPGLAFAIAESEDAARELIYRELNIDQDEDDEGLSRLPDAIVDVGNCDPYAAACWGSM